MMWAYVGGRALYLNIWSNTRGMCMDILPCEKKRKRKINFLNSRNRVFSLQLLINSILRRIRCVNGLKSFCRRHVIDA